MIELAVIPNRGYTASNYRLRRCKLYKIVEKLWVPHHMAHGSDKKRLGISLPVQNATIPKRRFVKGIRRHRYNTSITALALIPVFVFNFNLSLGTLRHS